MERYNGYFSLTELEDDRLFNSAKIECLRFSVFAHENKNVLTPIGPSKKAIDELIKNSDLFIGIYGKGLSRSNSLELIKYELQQAEKEFSKEDVIVFYKKGGGNDDLILDDLIKNYPNVFFYEDINEFRIKFSKAIKEWKIQRVENNPEKNEYLFSHKILTRCPDRSGILAALFFVIKDLHGNVTHFRQDIYSNYANIHLIVNWNKAPTKPALERVIKTKLGELYADKNQVRVIAEPIQKKDLIKTIAKFEIYFFDVHGISEMIFNLFSSHDITVLESNYRLVQTDDVFNIGCIIIFADISEKKDSIIDIITKKIRSFGHVFKVDKNKESGEFCY